MLLLASRDHNSHQLLLLSESSPSASKKGGNLASGGVSFLFFLSRFKHSNYKELLFSVRRTSGWKKKNLNGLFRKIKPSHPFAYLLGEQYPLKRPFSEHQRSLLKAATWCLGSQGKEA
ncbi:hypothetical protein L6164_000163 [Bauhinia variegata]|uniref:Uncharacterized protein n=1 Tax=Bauhinia variegata TaxID=167791 RepID=A0ACB9Q8C3_BAUVA|nr:hypothetical protein L6164_000163 [Bauhinia variegata]